MIAESESLDNPYAVPPDTGQLIGRGKIVRGFLVCVSIFLVLQSLPRLWTTLELANQEYLHLWNSQRVIYDIEIGGSPVSIDEAIRYEAAAVALQWLFAAALIVVPHWIARRLATR